MSSGMNRRAFLSGLGFQGAAAAAALGGCKRDADARPPEVIDPGTIDMKYRVLGRTGLKVSEVGFGAFPIDNPSVLDHAIDVGINYVDTAPDYKDGRSETVIGKAMARRRGDVVLATKWHPGPRTRKDTMLRSLEKSLKRLRTDHVDIVQVHSVADVARIENPELHEAFRLAKERGMARFLGVTSHSPTLMRVMDRAIELGTFDVLLCKYNFLDYPRQPELFRRAKAAGVGVVAMKTLGGAKHVDLDAFRGERDTFERAALKWVLSNPDVSTLIISISTFEQVRSFAAASGRKLARHDTDLLRRYAAVAGDQVCRGCEECHGACPAGVPVADVLRFSMYHDRYGERDQARRLYARLPGATAAACAGCPAPCVVGCFHGLDVPRQLAHAHAALA